MHRMEQLAKDYDRVEQTIRYLETHASRQPTLSEVAGSVGLSEFHFQRLFSRWVGISPKRFLQYLTKEHARRLIQGAASALDAALETGLSGPGRLHDLMVSCEALTPGELKRQGDGVVVTYGFHPSPFGTCLLARTSRGICGMRFVNRNNGDRLVDWLRRRWPKATLTRNERTTGPLARRVFGFAVDEPSAPLYLVVKGTNFQIQVWEALLRIPLGAAVTYEDIARHIGMPRAARAVGNAVGANPIPFLIPCHRVVRKAGEFGNYGEGPLRKKALLGWESARAQSAGAA